MARTDEQKYSAVLKELGDVLADKNTTISSQRWQIDQLKEKLAAAEKEREEACSKENAQGDGKTYWLLDKEAINTLSTINAELFMLFSEIESETCAEKLAGVQNAIKRILPLEMGVA